MARIRRTVSLKPEVDEVLEDKRGKNNLSNFVNDHFEKTFKPDIEKVKKKSAKKKQKKSPITKK